MTATGTAFQQGTGGNDATEKKRGGRHVQRHQEKRIVEVRVRTLNVGTMTGKGRELADMME